MNLDRPSRSTRPRQPRPTTDYRRHHRAGRCLALTLGLAGLPVAPAPVFAQENAAAAQEPAAGDIVVTAGKREQPLLDVPVSVAVIAGEAIAAAHILDLKDLSSLVPSLRVNQLQSVANTNFYIRGFGNGANNAGIETSVGLFVDGVYRSHALAMIGDLPDAERIEVLRGPQSTLFGKNASAGVVAVITRPPQDRFGGYVEASYGNRRAAVLRGLATGPIARDVLASIATSYERRDGYLADPGTGRASNDRKRRLIRAQLLVEPGAAVSVRMIGDYATIDEICCGAVNLRSSAATAALQALGGEVSRAGVVHDNFGSTNAIADGGVSGEVDALIGAFKLTSISAYRRSSARTDQDSDFTSADLIGRNAQALRIRTFTQELRVSASLLDRFSALVGAYYFEEHTRQNNQLQLGTQYRRYVDLLIRGQTGGAQSVTSLETLIGTLSGDPSLYAARFFAPAQGLDEAYALADRSWTVFGQADAKLTSRLTLTAGANYTHDVRRYSARIASTGVFSTIDLASIATAAANAGFGAEARSLIALRQLQILPPFLAIPNQVEPGRISDGDVTYAASLVYRLSEPLRVYLRYATGDKAASINLSRDSRPTAGDIAAIDAAGIAPVNLASGSRFAGPEHARVLEAGLKGDWGTATLALAVFAQAIRGFQSNVFNGTGFYLTNAGRQSVFGGEAEGRVRPLAGLTLDLALTYLDARYNRFRQSAFGDLSGTRPGGISPLTASLRAHYETTLGGGDRLILAGDVHYEARFRLVDGLPGLVVRDPATGAVIDAGAARAAARAFAPEVEEFNASATLALASGVSLSAWGRNLFDHRTLTQIFDTPLQSGSISGYRNQPRSYGLSARFAW